MSFLFSKSFVYNALACEMPHIANSQCKRIRINADEYTIDSTMKDLTFQNSTYNISSYEFLDDSYQKVEICVPESYSGAVVRLLCCYYCRCYLFFGGVLSATTTTTNEILLSAHL